MNHRSSEGPHKVRGASRLGVLAAAALWLACVFASAGAWAQGDGPRSQLPMPVGTNVLVPTWLNLNMNSDFSQSVLRADVDVNADILLGIYIRSFAIGDRYAQIWLVPNWGTLDASVDVARDGGGTVSRSVRESGFGDPYAAMKIGLIGAPALGLADFMKHKPTFQLYAYAGVYLPVGDYDSDRLLNLGTNRWGYRVGLPMVFPIGNPKDQINLEIHPGITFYGDNSDPTGGAGEVSQDELYQVEFHLSRNFSPKWWGSIGGRYRYGGETRTDGVADDNQQDVFGGELTLGYAFTPHLGLQATYGQVVFDGDGSVSDMIRLRMNYAF